MKTQRPIQRRTISQKAIPIAFLVAVCIIIASRLPSFSRPIWNVDEAFTAISANVLLQGGVPYRDSVDHRAPITYFVYALVFAVAGKNNMLAIHIALAVTVVGILALLALLARQVLPRRGVAFALIYFAAASMLAFLPDESYAFHTEWVVVVFNSIGMLLCWKALDGQRPLAIGLLSGICYGLAFFTKQPAFLDVLATLSFLGILAWVGPEAGTGVARRKVLTLMAAIAIGVIALSAVVCGYFIVRGAWDDFIFYVWTYNTNYYMRAMGFERKLGNMYAAYYSITPSLGLQLLAGCGGAVSLTRTAGWYGPRTPIIWRQFHITLWGISSLFAGLAGAREFGHYFIMLLPPWCILAGLAFDVGLSALRPYISAEVPAPRRRIRCAVVAFCVLWVFVPRMLVQFENVKWYVTKINEWADKDSHDRLISMLQQQCAPDERITVWGFNPVIYVLANRDPATRFSYATFVVGLVPGVQPTSREDAFKWAVPGGVETFIYELAKNRPKFVIDVSRKDPMGFYLFPLDGFIPAKAILDQSYELVPDFSPGVPGDDGTRVYRLRDERGR